jgi:hypothetical protein
MQMNDMMIISVDDHICEPPTLFDRQLTGDQLASAPKFLADKNGKNFWSYQGLKYPSVGLNAVVGRPFEECGMEPTALDQLRAGCYDVHARIDDMNINGIAASLNFGNSIHNDYRKPFWKVIADTETTICLHIGGGLPAPHASMETPVEAWITTMPMSIAIGASDWLQLEALQEYPKMRIARSRRRHRLGSLFSRASGLFQLATQGMDAFHLPN